MNEKMIKNFLAVGLTLTLVLATTGCTETQTLSGAQTESERQPSEVIVSSTTQSVTEKASDTVVEIETANENEYFTSRDLLQSPDLSEATYITLLSKENVVIQEEGIYVVTGEVQEVTIVVETPEDAKVQIVLDDVSITNTNIPVIYVKEADKVFVTTTQTNNVLSVTGAFVADGDVNLDAVIFSRSDLVLNGFGTLDITSIRNGVTSKDDLKITGGTYQMTVAHHGLEANDGIYIADGSFNIKAGADALHSEYDEDDAVGEIYIADGQLTLTAQDDAIRGTTWVKIDGGIINILSSTEGIEATFIQINGGDITVYASDDGINASQKSSAIDLSIEVNGGKIYVKVGSGDTDGFDSNGTIVINGGIITVDANSAFDSDGLATLNGGTVTVNGQVITEITQSRMGGGGGTRPGRNR